MAGRIKTLPILVDVYRCPDCKAYRFEEAKRKPPIKQRAFPCSCGWHNTWDYLGQAVLTRPKEK